MGTSARLKKQATSQAKAFEVALILDLISRNAGSSEHSNRTQASRAA